MPVCGTHGFYVTPVCGMCAAAAAAAPAAAPASAAAGAAAAVVNTAAAPVYDADVHPFAPNGAFAVLVTAAAGMGAADLAALVTNLIDSNKNVGFGSRFGLKGLNQRYAEFSAFSEPDPKHVFWYGQQVNALKLVLGICTDKGAKFTKEQWAELNLLMNRPPPHCKPGPKYSRDDDASGGGGGGGVRLGPRPKVVK